MKPDDGLLAGQRAVRGRGPNAVPVAVQAP